MLRTEQALSGSVALRNPVVAEVFKQMELYESWGTGLRRIRSSCEALGLPAPEFQEIGNMFRPEVLLQTGTKTGTKTLRTAQERKRYAILEMLRDDPEVSIRAVAQALSLSPTTVSTHVKALREEGLIERADGKKGGKWIVKD